MLKQHLETSHSRQKYWITFHQLTALPKRHIHKIIHCATDTFKSMPIEQRWSHRSCDLWMHADVKPYDMVRQIFAVRCLNQNFQMLLWSLTSTHIAIHFIQWRHAYASCAEWGTVIIVVCSWSLLTSLETCCRKWLNCLICMYCSGSLHRSKGYIYSTIWNNTII